MTSGLAALEARLADELAFLQLPAPRWTPAREHDGQPVADVAIVGAGMTGLALAAALVQRGVSVVAYDEAPAGLEGPWATTARMETLRSPKQLAGPALGIPSLTLSRLVRGAVRPRRLGGARQDPAPAVDGLPALVPRRAGAAGVERPSRHRPAAARRRPVELAVDVAGRPRRAPGRAGSWSPPAAPASAAPRFPPSPRPCRGRAGRTRPTTTTTPRSPACASASSAPARRRWTAPRPRSKPAPRRCICSCGAPTCRASTRARAPAIPASCRATRASPDDWKWRIRHYINTQQVPPPRNSTQRVSRHANAHFHLGVAIEGVEERGGALQRPHLGRADRARLPDLRHRLQASTGGSGRCCATSRRASALWKDRYQPPPDADDAELAGLARPRRGVRVPAARRRALPGPRTPALPLLPGDALARRDHRRHPGDQRRRAAARRPARRACSTSRTSSTTSRASRPTPSPRSSATNGSPSPCRLRHLE